MSSLTPSTVAPTDLSLEAHEISKSFRSHQAVKGITLHVSPGEVVSIVGPSGAGKSTFLRCLNLLEEPDGGSLRVGDTTINFGPPNSKPPRKDLLYLRRNVGMVFQSFNLFPHLSVLKNVSLPQQRTLGVPRADADTRSQALLERVGLGSKMSAYPSQCSGGQQQRIAIARALALDPAVILFDEPTSALDPEVGAEILIIMRELADEGMTMVVVTHEMAFARDVSERMLVLYEGSIIEEGPPKEIIKDPTDERTRKFFGAVLGR